MLRGQNTIPSVRPLCYLLLNIGQNPTKFGVHVTHINGVCNSKKKMARLLGPLGEIKNQISLNCKNKVNFKVFDTKLFCVLTNKSYIEWDFCPDAQDQ